MECDRARLRSVTIVTYLVGMLSGWTVVSFAMRSVPGSANSPDFGPPVGSFRLPLEWFEFQARDGLQEPLLRCLRDLRVLKDETPEILQPFEMPQPLISEFALAAV